MRWHWVRQPATPVSPITSRQVTVHANCCGPVVSFLEIADILPPHPALASQVRLSKRRQGEVGPAIQEAHP